MGCICGLAAWLIKYILFFANVLFVLSGIGIIVVGALVQSSFVDYDELLHGQFSGAAIAIIVIGCLVFVVAFCGCCGAISESRPLLYTYGSLLLVILITQVGIGIWALATPNASESLARNEMKELFVKEYQNGGPSDIFDRLQSDLECCGVDGPKDFSLNGSAIYQVPKSCCDEDLALVCNSVTAYRTGCYNQLTSFIDDMASVIGIVTICVAATEVMAMVFAFCYAGHLKS